MLLARLGVKASRTNWKDVNAKAAWEKLNVFSRIAKAYVNGTYRNIPWKSIATVLAAIIYFVNPFDLIPDFIPVLGLGDDFAVLMAVYNSISADVNNFLEWEKKQLPAS
jgi:uncharacterized membrane protein YkvA (DUF1232 family)